MKTLSDVRLGLLALTLGGCSALFVKRPPPEYERLDAFTCTDRNLIPTADVLLTALIVWEALDAFSVGSNDTQGRYLVAFSIGAPALGFAASAVYGFRSTSHCRAALAELSRRPLPSGGGASPLPIE